MMKSKLGERLKELRTKNKITQKELAKILNIRNTTLSQYENGVNEPNDEMKLKIADYFNVSIDYLLGRVEDKDIAIMEGDEIPKELLDIGVDYLEVTKEFKKKGFTPEQLMSFLKTLEELKKNNNQ